MRAFDPKWEMPSGTSRAAGARAPRCPSTRLSLAPHPGLALLLGMLIRLVRGCAWIDVESLLGGQVSDTTLRARRDEWIAAGVFDALSEEALAAYDALSCSTSPSQPGRLTAQGALRGRRNGPKPHRSWPIRLEVGRSSPVQTGSW